MINGKELESLIKLLDDPDTEVSQHVEERTIIIWQRSDRVP